MPQPDPARLSELGGRITGSLPLFEDLLAGRDFLFGALSLADVTVMSPMSVESQPRRSSSSRAAIWPMMNASSIATPNPVSSRGPKS